MKIVSMHLTMCLFVLLIVLVGCNPSRGTFPGQSVNLIDDSIPIDEYGEQAKVVIDWMHKNNYGLRQSDFYVVPVYFNHIPDNSKKEHKRDYSITHKRHVISEARHLNQPNRFSRVESGNITLEVHKNHLIIRIKDIGQTHLPIAILDEIASAQPNLELHERLAAADVKYGTEWIQLLPTDTEFYPGKVKAVIEWMKTNNYSLIKENVLFEKYSIRSENGELSESFYVGEIVKAAHLDLEEDTFQKFPYMKDAEVIRYVPMHEDLEVVDKIVVGDFTLQTAQSHFVIHIKGVGEVRFPIGDETRRHGRPINDAKLFQHKTKNQR